MRFHDYFRSAASYRVRIALALKGLPCDHVAVHVARGEHKKEPGAAMSAAPLVWQIFNAQRFDVSLQGLPRTMAAYRACITLPAFERAQPSSCPDFEP